MLKYTVVVLLLFGSSHALYDPNCNGKTVIVHLFEWRWTSIAAECERFLSQAGYCGVQVSPPNEHVVLSQNDFPWWQRYQPVSYHLDSRSGSRAEFQDMVERCNNVGVRIYVDAVVNHMAGMDREGTGSGGSSFNTMNDKHDFPAVPYSDADFTPREKCTAGCGCVDNYADPNIVRDCYLVGLSDLYGATDHVQEMIAGYFNDLIDMGVAGFRVDAAKHMWPEDIAGIQSRLHSLSTKHGFTKDSSPFFYHEVIDRNDGAVLVDEYFDLGWVTEFRYSQKIGWAANGDWGMFGGLYDPGWGMGPADRAFVFVDNHDNQRGHGGGGDVVTHQSPDLYTAAVCFMLAFDYGFTRVMSSYYFGEDTDMGPPHLDDGQYTTADVPINDDGSCGGGWVCEHRWNAISKMAAFRTACNGAPSENFWSEGDSAGIARTGKGYFAMSKKQLTKDVQTGMPGGEYTNIIDGSKVTVNSDGTASMSISNSEGIFAICVGCDGQGPGPTSAPGPSTTTTTNEPQPTNSPTDPPSPGEKKRTLIFIEKQSSSGQDVFIRGGISPSTSIPITMRQLPQQWELYNDWIVGDTQLDWNGAEQGQGQHNGQDALGTPAGWTTSDSGNDFHHDFNTWGDHYWIADMDMDCSATKDGWFEVETLFTNGGEGGESQISQSPCSGSVGGTVPFSSQLHAGRCGYMNVFHYNSNECLIETIP